MLRTALADARRHTSTAWGTASVRINPLDAPPSTITAIVYAERTEWRDNPSDQGRERVMLRSIGVDSSLCYPLGSTFTVDDVRYTIESADTFASGRRILTGRRVNHAEVTRPGYRRT